MEKKQKIKAFENKPPTSRVFRYGRKTHPVPIVIGTGVQTVPAIPDRDASNPVWGPG
ncbi:MAG: hypothetical protein IT240_00545 [Bacteroidia bacterium]|nr:hypothetical protein [Bacteroidia bacterium]